MPTTYVQYNIQRAAYSYTILEYISLSIFLLTSFRRMTNPTVSRKRLPWNWKILSVRWHETTFISLNMTGLQSNCVFHLKGRRFITKEESIWWNLNPHFLFPLPFCSSIMSSEYLFRSWLNLKHVFQLFSLILGAAQR